MRTILIYKERYTPPRNPYPSRQPLSVLWEPLRENSLRRRKPLSTHSKSSPPKSTPLSRIPRNIKIHSCPHCCSPAKELNLRRASCIKCGFDFCRDCSKAWHKAKCKGISSGEDYEVKRSSSVNIAGTARSKKRLKRL